MIEGKKGHKKKSIHMDHTEGAPNLEFFSEGVRREWKGKSSHYILQIAAFAIACLTTGPTLYQPMDYYHIEPDTDMHRGGQDGTAQSPKRATV